MARRIPRWKKCDTTITRSRRPCGNPSGAGTAHPGTGRCWLHERRRKRSAPRPEGSQRRGAKTEPEPPADAIDGKEPTHRAPASVGLARGGVLLGLAGEEIMRASFGADRRLLAELWNVTRYLEELEVWVAAIVTRHRRRLEAGQPGLLADPAEDHTHPSSRIH